MMTNINTGLFDKIVYWLVAAALLCSAVMLFNAGVNGEKLGDWIWNRHQNQFSWYSRPLFIVPACYYAYRQNIFLIAGFMVLLFCSLFWFSAPDQVPEHVMRYLEWEKQLFLSNESVFTLLLMVLAVVVYLYLLFYAFWRRNPWMGLVLINVGTITKIVVSISLGKEAGGAAVVPSLSSLAIINTFALVIWKRKKMTDPD